MAALSRAYLCTKSRHTHTHMMVSSKMRPPIIKTRIATQTLQKYNSPVFKIFWNIIKFSTQISLASEPIILPLTQ